MGLDLGPNSGSGGLVSLSGAPLGDIGGIVPDEGRDLRLSRTVVGLGGLTHANFAQYIYNNRTFNPRDYDPFAGTYAGGPFTRDDYPALQNAISAAASAYDAKSGPNVVEIPAGVYVIQSTTLTVDLGKVTLRAVGGLVTFLSGLGAGVDLVNYYSSQAATEQAINATSGVFGILHLGLQGNGQYGASIGNVAYPSAGSQLLFLGCGFRRFARNVAFRENAYRSQFLHCSLFDVAASGQHIYFPPGLSNAGEVLTFAHCMIANTVGASTDAQIGEVLLAGRVQMDFIHCSLLNARLKTTGEADVHWVGGNLENPGSTLPYTMIDVGAAGLVQMHGARMVLDDPGGSGYTVKPFNVASDARGLLIDGFKFPGGAFLTMQNGPDGDALRAFVRGTGRVFARNITPYGQPSTWSAQAFPVLCRQMSATRNADYETGTLPPWAATPYGTGGSAAVSTLAVKNGTYGLRVTVTGGGAGGVNTVQTVPCSPQQFVQLHAWTRCSVATVGAVVQVAFLDSAGAVISTLSSATLTATTFAEIVINGIAPAGTVNAQVILNAQYLTTGGTVDFDDALLILG